MQPASGLALLRRQLFPPHGGRQADDADVKRQASSVAKRRFVVAINLRALLLDEYATAFNACFRRRHNIWFVSCCDGAQTSSSAFEWQLGQSHSGERRNRKSFAANGPVLGARIVQHRAHICDGLFSDKGSLLLLLPSAQPILKSCVHLPDTSAGQLHGKAREFYPHSATPFLTQW